MSEKKSERKKREKKNKKDKLRRKNENNCAMKEVEKGKKDKLMIYDKDNSSISINLSHLQPPKTVYHANCFTVRKCFGYSDLFFGQTDPRKTDNPILNTVVIRVPENTIRDMIIRDHKPFYEGVFKTHKVTEEYFNHFDINIESQFPNTNYAFFSTNFLYAAHGNGEGELMYYRISPSYIHHLSSGEPAIIPDQRSIEEVLTIRVPFPLLAFIYHRILESDKNE